MAYNTNINAPKARGDAMKLLIQEQLPVGVVALRLGVNRSTIWRWRCKWQQQNSNIHFVSSNRINRQVKPAGYIPGVGAVSKFKLQACTWNISTLSSRPHSHPRAIPARIVKAVLETREKLKRCAEVVWHHVNFILNIKVSLSSVRRILQRHHCFDGARKPRVKRSNPRRPLPTKPGELVQTDTIHHVDPYSGKRLYYYTVIDLYTRMTHAVLATKLRPELAARAVLEAQAKWGFAISMVQSDNGPEYGHYFERTLKKAGIPTRHSRLHRPNDNAHIERFNRTIQTECIGHYWRRNIPLSRQQAKLANYLDFYNNHRVHLGIQLRTPREMLQRF